MPTILITGASSGIGKATAKYFLTKGWQVIATMRSPEKERELNQLAHIELVQLDVTNRIQAQKVIQNAITKYGQIDAIVNNAGYGLIGAFESATEAQIRAQFETNVFGLMNMCQEILPHFREKKAGTIINISSMGGRISLPYYSLYMSTKWTVEGLSESLQFELAPFQIRVKLVEPGAIKTDFFGRSMVTTTMPPDSEYHQSFTQMTNQMEGLNGAEPNLVAAAIYRAATDQSGKLRYPVGKDAKMLLFLHTILPDRLWSWIIKKFFHIKNFESRV